MKTAQVLAAAISSAALVVLQGCGGASDPTPQPSTTPSPSPSSATTTTTTTAGSHTPPLSGAEAADYLNGLYKAYSIENASSAPGVVMRTADSWGFFCPGFKDYDGCYYGYAKCVTSASILNDKVMLTGSGQIEMGLKRRTGIIFNTSIVESKLGRCTYQYDGTSWGRYNRGCGSTAVNGPDKCNDTSSAWSNIDPATGKECTVDAEVVMSDYCPNRDLAGTAPLRADDPPCFWKGPAFDIKNGLLESETREMMQQRLARQQEGAEVDKWNEVVVDAELLLQELRFDPALVVPAVVYADGGNDDDVLVAKQMAQQIADEMQKEFSMPAPVPIIGVDTTLHISAQPDVPGPFFYNTKWTTGTTTSTTSTPRTSASCCQDSDCSKDCSEPSSFCGKSKNNCESSCAGTWCPAPEVSFMV